MKLPDTDQFKNGKTVEAWLDNYFRRQGWVIVEATPHEERVLCLGDRRFKKGHEAYWIEYKSGIQTFYTGNVFLETISVDTANKPGWVFTCRADYIFYAALLNHKILVFRPQRLRDNVKSLRARFRERATSKGQNATYNTIGLVVPLVYVETLAEKIIQIEEL